MLMKQSTASLAWVAAASLFFSASLAARPPPAAAPAPAPSPSTASPGFPWLDPSLPVDQRVDALLARLTPEQKALQLQTDPTGGLPELGVPDNLWQAECSHGVKLGGAGSEVPPDSGNGATIYPQSLTQAATFDDALIFQMAAEVSDEARALHNHYRRERAGEPPAFTNCYSPHVAIVRDPRWGRLSETFGEDPLLQSRMAVAYVRGLQGSPSIDQLSRGAIKVGATCKHFLGHDVENDGQGHTCHNWDAEIDPRDMRDTYLPHFEACVREAGSVMCAYSAVDGSPSCASQPLLTDLLRNKLGFEGFVVSDNRVLLTTTTEPPTGFGFAGGDLWNASTQMVQAGMDMFMKDSSYLKPSELAADRLNAAARRVLTARVRQGHLDPPGSLAWDSLDTSVIGTPAHVATARAIAAKGTVLLKNEGGLLPLNPSALKRVHLVGPFANTSKYLLGRNFGAAAGTIATPLTALQAALPGAAVTYNAESAYRYTPEHVQADAEACQAADACILFLGTRLSREDQAALTDDDQLPENSYDFLGEGEGFDRPSLLLQANQQRMFEELAQAVDKTLIVVLVHGGPLDVSGMQDSAEVGAILSAWVPGQHGALAITDILLGELAPSGRSPLTWYKESYSRLPIADSRMRASDDYPGRTYRYFRGNDTLYPFGFGLSYSNFSLAGASVAPTAGGASAAITVSQTGGMEAETAVLLFVSYLGQNGTADTAGLPSATLAASGCNSTATSTDLVQRLVGYQRTQPLVAGASQRLSFSLELGAGSNSSWAGFGDPQPPCGAYGLRFGWDQPTAAVLVLAA